MGSFTNGASPDLGRVPRIQADGPQRRDKTDEQELQNAHGKAHGHNEIVWLTFTVTNGCTHPRECPSPTNSQPCTRETAKEHTEQMSKDARGGVSLVYKLTSPGSYLARKFITAQSKTHSNCEH